MLVALKPRMGKGLFGRRALVRGSLKHPNEQVSTLRRHLLHVAVSMREFTFDISLHYGFSSPTIKQVLAR